MTKNVELQLTNDYIFKRLFSKKGNEDILKDLLEGILEIPIEKVEVMQEVELERVDIKDKLGVLDIKAVVNEDTTVDIEMQIADEKNMIERTLFYWSGLYYTGLKRGQDYKLNNKVITINILMYNIFKEEKYHTIATIKEDENNKKITDKLEIHFIELPKFLKSKEIGNKKLRQWLDFICNKRKGEIEMAVKENEKIAKASQEWEYLRGDEAVKRMAFLKEKWERDWNSGMHSAEEAGIEKGMKKGKREEKKEIAIKMIHEKIDEEIISKVTNLSLDEIEKLKEEINIK
ncbi:MAG: Rpn family recombination-promoting nuclease/putative transposase [Monoglobales bacterium]